MSGSSDQNSRPQESALSHTGERLVLNFVLGSSRSMQVLPSFVHSPIVDEKQLRLLAANEVSQQLQNNEQKDNIEMDDPHSPIGGGRLRSQTHAKRTRLRKKAFLSRLQGAASQQRKDRDCEEQYRDDLGVILEKMMLCRRNSLLLFLMYRSKLGVDASIWCQIVASDFTFSQPNATYRHVPLFKPFVGNHNVIQGIPGLIADTKCLRVFLCQAAVYVKCQSIEVQYEPREPDECQVSGDSFAVSISMKLFSISTGNDWNGKEIGVREGGSVKQLLVSCPAVLTGRFNSHNLLSAAALFFDAKHVESLLKGININVTETGVPNTATEIPNYLTRNEQTAALAIFQGLAFQLFNPAWLKALGGEQPHTQGCQGTETNSNAEQFWKELHRVLSTTSALDYPFCFHFRQNCSQPLLQPRNPVVTSVCSSSDATISNEPHPANSAEIQLSMYSIGLDSISPPVILVLGLQLCHSN